MAAANKKNLWQKLQEVQSQIKVNKSKFFISGKGEKQKRVDYRGLDEILNELKPMLDLQGLYMYQSDKIIQLGNNYFVEVTTTIIDADTGESLANTSSAEIDYKAYMNESQKTGSAITYARKNGLSELLGICEESDADDYERDKDYKQKQYERQQQSQQQAQKQTTGAKAEATITQKQIDAINALLKSNDDIAIANQVLAEAGYKSPKEIKASDYVSIGSEIKRRLQAK